MRRLAVFFAAGYLWIGLGVPFPAPAQAPSAEASLAEEFLCEGHSCGCASAEDCRRHCCCFPRQEPKESSPIKKPLTSASSDRVVSFRAAMACWGQETGGPAVSSSSFGAHLPVEVASLKGDPSRGRAPGIPRFSRRAIPADPPGKIPI